MSDDNDKVVKVVDAMMRDINEHHREYYNRNYNHIRRVTTRTSFDKVIVVEAPRKVRWWNMNFKSRADRMSFAFGAAVVFAVAVPVVIGVLLMLATGFLYSYGMGGHWIRHHIWGWLSDFNSYKEHGKTHEASTPKLFPLTYFTSVVVVYVVYLIAEGITLVGEGYAELARGRKITNDGGSID